MNERVIITQSMAMRSFNKNLLDDEMIVFQTRKHIIIFFFPVLWIIFCFFAMGYINDNPILANIYWVPWLIALIFLGYVWLQYISSDYIVTNKRVVMREGVFSRHMNDTRLSSVSQISVNQSLFAQIFNFGTVSIHAFGAFDTFTMIAKPYQLQKSVNEQLEKVVK